MAGDWLAARTLPTTRSFHHYRAANRGAQINAAQINAQPLHPRSEADVGRWHALSAIETS
jgi:hypothetical protein